MKKRHPATLLLIASLWLGGISAGSIALWDHEFTEGQSSDAPLSLPAELGALAKDEKPLTLFMAVHPGCPCTGASLEQVDRLIAGNPDSIQLIGLVRARGESSETATGATLQEEKYWKRLEAMPNAHPYADHDGALARLLGTHTSGATIAYDETGGLRFQGGITPSRGHAGPSRSMDELEAIARQLAPLELCSSPTFGCSLENDPDLL
ncbi:hypothetical protein [Pelagicoccus sp. SDUM812002]|uniref:hypothetical protein n=1 Tax=Pelagicoccus sp. SDUM812002 TaxID=3041266 RepID=UPI00280DF65B|nr:hypothetical protein [Pelagicoccus sp. SDUM812002]MDQ8184834.1 hypothetical protein [Pelagicoccus sp. SDUM812002]